MIKTFDVIKGKVLNNNKISRCLVAGAADDHAIEAVFEAADEKFLKPILIGDEKSIIDILKDKNLINKDYDIIHCPDGTNPAEVAVKAVHDGIGDFILKGKLETRDLLKPIVNKEKGLNSKGFITHFGLMQIASYHKLLAMSDSAVIPYPTLEDKAKILNICLETLRKLGLDEPIAGILCAVENVNPQMIETVHAQALVEMAKEGKFGNCHVLGPISYDLATSKESVKIKNYSEYGGGNVDMLLVPQMVTGNVMSKIWNIDERNILAGCLVGADVPIALTSRAAGSKEKLYSLMLCSALS